MKKLIVLVFLFLLNACGSITKKECVLADWYTIGLEGGSKGVVLASDIARYRKACAKADIVPDPVAYQRGHEQGLKTYCHKANGYNLGKSGRAYQGICHSNNENLFLKAYNRGREYHRYYVSFIQAQKHHDAIYQKLEQASQESTYLEDSIINGTNTPEQRHRLIHDIRSIDAAIDNLNKDLSWAKDNMDIKRRDYEALKNQHRDLGY